MISACSSPGMVCSMASCTSSGMEEEKPCTYSSSVRRPIGSMNNWWRGLSANRTTFVSMDGQYRGPTPWITPE